MINSINGWVEDNRNLGMFSKIINGEHVQTYVAPDGNVHRKLALVEAHLTNPVLLHVIPHIFASMAAMRPRPWKLRTCRRSTSARSALQAWPPTLSVRLHR